jgi:DNA polymerase
MRRAGATFALPDIGWLDFETRSTVDIKAAGAFHYATKADAILCGYAIGEGDPVTVTGPLAMDPVLWDDMPDDFRAHHARVVAGEAIWAAWNAGFDKAIWNYSTDFPELSPYDIIDVMAQATAAGLPPDLAMASRMAGGSHTKVEGGKALIRLFCTPEGLRGVCGTPQSHPEEWAQFLTYLRGDITSMRDVFKITRQLPIEEWREYWAMERVNERGVYVDERMVAHAASLAAEDSVRSRQELSQITAGAVNSVDEIAKLTKWLLDRLPPEGRAILLEREEETDQDGVITRPAKFALTRGQVQRLIVLMKARYPGLHKVIRALEIRLYGGSKTPAKFAKIQSSHVDGILYGQYVFNGAGQTGRASSRGVQIHNLARDTLPYEHDAIEGLLRGVNYGVFSTLGDDSPVSRKLSLLIRPAFIPGGDRVFVWSDWSQIEARILPWLAGDQNRLDIFRAVDRDKSVPDIYTRTAAAISHITIQEVTKPIRQRGKVAELALGFGGGVGALHAMGAGYGLHLDDTEAKTIVTRWREANPWCVAFWARLMEAVESALTNPGKFFSAGRVAYRYEANYLGGSLICVLPSLRVLTYRAIRYDRVEELDEDDQPTGQFSTKLRFSRGYGRVNLWHGMFCENIVQAVAADCLRGTLVRLEEEGFYTRLHTHDEVVVECNESNAKYIARRLREVMQRGFDWSDGLPLMSEETISPYYTKQES